jgi:hypothetical protein
LNLTIIAKENPISIYMKKLFVILISVQFALTGYGQCAAGENEVTIEISTDNYGYETYWELVPLGNSCGVGTIFSGGNSAVGCNGGGTATPGSGYGNDATVSEGPWCLTDGASYSIIVVDDYGDGGAKFAVNIGGYAMHEFGSTGNTTTNSFVSELPPELEVELRKINTPAYVNGGDISISGELHNNGATVITSIDVNYTINNGTTVTSNLTGLSLQPFGELKFNHPTFWQESTIGQYSVKLWVTNINGNLTDFDESNNEQTKLMNVKNPIPNIIPSYLDAGTTLDFVVVAGAADQVTSPTDLDFHPNGDLWIVNRNTESAGGSTVKITDPTGTPTTLWQRDGNAWHFMSLPSAIAFSDNGNFGTTTSIFDANHNSTTSGFTGPSLWSSDPDVYAQPSGGNGSHLDMLHASPYCLGMSFYHDNAFWVFDKNSNDIVMYDFKEDHGPGADDHSDGVILRYPEISVDWINEDIPAHLKYDKYSDMLYIVDGGNSRILKMDVNSGTVEGTPSYNNPEPVAQYENVTGVTYEELTNAGFSQACGIDVMTNYMVVSDYSNGDIIIYNNNSTPSAEVGRISTGSAGVTGVVIGPEGRIWYTNILTQEVVKIEPSQVILSAEEINLAMVEPKFSLYPSPASSNINLNFNEVWNSNIELTIHDIYGKVILSQFVINNTTKIDVSQLSSGMYIVNAKDGATSAQKTFVVN